MFSLLDEKGPVPPGQRVSDGGAARVQPLADDDHFARTKPGCAAPSFLGIES